MAVEKTNAPKLVVSSSVRGALGGSANKLKGSNGIAFVE